MSDGHIPAPDFDRSKYERPNKNWICGHACEGCPCRIGPSPSGDCRATAECKPQLVLRPGEDKGTWKCTRPKEWGGSCELGPNPDGTCCNVIPKCRPVRSLRGRRGLVVRGVIAAAVAGLVIALTGPARDDFINPGKLSSHHSGPEFERMAGAVAHASGQACAACHREAGPGPASWPGAALQTGRQSFRFTNLASDHPKDFSRMDATCVACHQNQSFHQPNVARDTACSVCHLEHQGGGPLPAVAMQRCVDCHGDASQMAEAERKSRDMPQSFFTKAEMPGVVSFARERPSVGFTKVIHSFEKDHPEFRILRLGLRDDNTLAFNHAKHLTGDNIPLLRGKPLTCTSCHQLDTSGAFMQRVSFEQNCRSCHSLQFDERNPAMQLPHGDAAYVRAYLRSLPAQYADHAQRVLGLTGTEAVDRFVKEQMAALRKQAQTGEVLEDQVFFSGAKGGPAAGIAGMTGQGRANFAGCAYCHEVTPRDNGNPVITKPVMPDRWMIHAQFNHSRHAQVDCTTCHAAVKSSLTSDIIMPTQQSCTECHSPKGGVSFSCSECHTYHNAVPAAWRANLLK